MITNTEIVFDLYVNDVSGQTEEIREKQVSAAKEELDSLLARLKHLEDREVMAKRLLVQCKPYVDDMLGIASSVRVLSPQIEYFMEDTLVLED